METAQITHEAEKYNHGDTKDPSAQKAYYEYCRNQKDNPFFQKTRDVYDKLMQRYVKEVEILKKSEVVVVVPVCARDEQKLLRTLEEYAHQKYDRSHPFSVIVLLNGKEKEEGALLEIENKVCEIKKSFNDRPVTTLNIIPVVCTFSADSQEFANTNIAHLREMGTILVAMARSKENLKTMIVSHDADLEEDPYGRQSISSKYMETVAKMGEKENLPLVAGADKFSLTCNDRMNFIINLTRYWNVVGDLKNEHIKHRESPQNSNFIKRRVYPEEHNSAFPLERFLRAGGYTPDKIDLKNGTAESSLLKENMGLSGNQPNLYSPTMWLVTDSRRIQATAVDLNGVFPGSDDIWGDWGNDGAVKRNSQYDIPDLAIEEDENFNQFAKNVVNSLFFKLLLQKYNKIHFQRIVCYLTEILLNTENEEEVRIEIEEELEHFKVGVADMLKGVLCAAEFNSDSFIKYLNKIIEDNFLSDSQVQGKEISDIAIEMAYNNIERIEQIIKKDIQKISDKKNENVFGSMSVHKEEMLDSGIVEKINFEKFSRLMRYRRKMSAKSNTDVATYQKSS